MITRHLWILVLIFILTSHLSCRQDTPTPEPTETPKVEDTYTPRFTAEALAEKLEAAYQASSEEMLEAFFAEWNKSISPNTPEFIASQDAVTRDIYEIYRVFFHPWDLPETNTAGPWDSKINANCRYAVVGTRIYDRSEDPAREINDFRPPVDLPPEQVLYMTPEYEEALTIFLGAWELEARWPGESKKRYAFLRPFIPINPGHDAGWHLATYPIIHSFHLDSGLENAEVGYRVMSSGRRAMLVKKDGKWVVEHTTQVWIE